MISRGGTFAGKWAGGQSQTRSHKHPGRQVGMKAVHKWQTHSQCGNKTSRHEGSALYSKAWTPGLQADMQTDSQAGRQPGRQTARQADRWADRQAGRQASRQAGRQVGAADIRWKLRGLPSPRLDYLSPSPSHSGVPLTVQPASSGAPGWLGSTPSACCPSGPWQLVHGMMQELTVRRTGRNRPPIRANENCRTAAACGMIGVRCHLLVKQACRRLTPDAACPL